MELTHIPNPYDFANPVTEKSLFAGRRQELTDIYYYLDLAQSARPIGLALIGERASGKTSLLNMLESAALSKGFVTARVDLDEGVVQSSARLLFKIAHELIMTSIEKHGAFGGREGPTCETYLNMVSMFEIPEDKIHCPFLVPLQYAKAMSVGKEEVVDLEIAFIRDLQTIREELGCPIALLLDECDVLLNNRVLLQKLRNLFNRDKQTLLVMVGTEALAHQMNEVYSPIMRGFKQIDVRPFERPSDTTDCIRKPLEGIGIDEPSDLLELETYMDLLDVHRLTGGTPYEIQLLCHVMFREVQEGRSERMGLSVETLEAVMDELARSGNLSGDSVVSEIRSLSFEELVALSLASACEKGATRDRLWFWEYLLHGSEGVSEARLGELLRNFVDRGILDETDGNVRFRGQPIERVFVKYVARNAGVRVTMGHPNYTVALFTDFRIWLQELFEDSAPAYLRKSEEDELIKLLQAGTALGTIFREVPPFVESYYWACFSEENCEAIAAFVVALQTPWDTSVSQVFCMPDTNGSTGSIVASGLEGIMGRAAELNGEVTLRHFLLPVLPAEEIELFILELDARIRRSISYRHRARLSRKYRERAAAASILREAEGAVLFNPSADNLNNRGYLKLATGDFVGARVDFLEVLSQIEMDGDESLTGALAEVNLAVVEAMEGNCTKSRERLDSVRERLMDLDPEDRDAWCLFVLEIEEGGGITFTERLNPDSLNIVEESLAVLACFEESE